MENKHFSHSHGLIYHQMPQDIEIQCSGCKSYSTSGGAVYVCWQCSYFLHDQCYRATRSMKHSSHPSHPLTLVPFPTYPSNSFYCNHCNFIGTGFSYCCSDFRVRVWPSHPLCSSDPKFPPFFCSWSASFPDCVAKQSDKAFQPSTPSLSTRNERWWWRSSTAVFWLWG